MSAQHRPRRIIRLPQVIERTGESWSVVYRKIAAGIYRPVKLGPRSIGFFDDEIDAVLDALAAARDAEEVA